MRYSILSKFLILTLISGALFLLSSSEVYAEMSFIKGDVYTRHPVTGKKVLLPGVKIYRQDGDGALVGDTDDCQTWIYNKNAYWPWAAKKDKWDCQQSGSCTVNQTKCDEINKKWNREKGSEGYCDPTKPATNPGPKPSVSVVAADVANHCRADHGNVQTKSESDGSYYMGNGEYLRNDPNVWDMQPPPDVVLEENDPPPVTTGYIYGYQRLCASTNGRGIGPYTGGAAIDMKTVSYKGNDYTQLNFCGFSCLENPHHLKAFFPDGWYNQYKNLIPWVTDFDTTDVKGGGTWKTRFDNMPVGFWGYTSRTIADSHASKPWPDPLYGDYAIEEFYEVYIGNNMGFDGFDFEWVPPKVQGNPPSIDTVTDSNNTPWIGTPEDTDNGVACTDNNPYTYKMTGHDPDGSKDVDIIEFSLAKSSQLNDGGQRDWPLRILFAQKWVEDAGREYAENTFFVRDAELQGGSSDKCMNSSGAAVNRDPTGLNKVGGGSWSVGSNPSTLTAKSDSTYSLWCYGVDNHSWQNGASTQASFDGKNWDVYYITKNITVDGDGYGLRLFGSNNTGGWQGNSYVAFERGGGTGVTAQFRVEYLGGGTPTKNDISVWTGEYHNMWKIRDITDLYDTTPNAYPGKEVVKVLAGEYHHAIGKTLIDFKYPTINLDVPNPLGGNDITIPWYAADTGGSKLDRAWGDLEANIGSAPFIWDVTGLSTNRHPSSGWINTPHTLVNPPAGPIDFAGRAQDHACNINQNSGSGAQLILYRPWLITRGGLVYSRDAVNILAKDLDGTLNLCPDGDQNCPPFGSYPWDEPRQEVALSTEWLSTGASFSSDHLINWTTASTFQSKTYQDLNNKSWFGVLEEKANRNLTSNAGKYTIVNGLGNPGSNISSNCPNSDKVCVIKTSGTWTLSSELRCDRQTFIFVYGDLNISNKVIADGNANGCIFAVQNNVTINPIRSGANSDDYPEYDTLEMFVLSDGRININPTVDQANPYGIQVWGGLLGFGNVDGHSLYFDRTLKNKFNQDKPAYQLHHDARYYDIARKVVDDDKEAYKEEVGHKGN